MGLGVQKDAARCVRGGCGVVGECIRCGGCVDLGCRTLVRCSTFQVQVVYLILTLCVFSRWTISQPYALYTPLLTYHRTTEAPEPTYSQVFTALIHRVNKAEQFRPLAAFLIEQFTSLPQKSTSTATSPLSFRRRLEAVSVRTAVRGGSRLTQSHLNKLFAATNTLHSASPRRFIEIH